MFYLGVVIFFSRAKYITKNRLLDRYLGFKLCDYPWFVKFWYHAHGWQTHFSFLELEGIRGGQQTLWTPSLGASLFSRLVGYRGRKTGHLLALIAHAQRGTTYISALSNKLGELQTDTDTILGIMSDYYNDLYSSKQNATPADITSFLAGVTTLSLTQRSSFDSPVTLEELQIAVRCLANNKSPGLDGLPNELFKKCCDVLLPWLLEVFQHSAITGRLPTTMQEALIIVLLKPGKDPFLPKSYRPISLLPVDGHSALGDHYWSYSPWPDRFHPTKVHLYQH